MLEKPEIKLEKCDGCGLCVDVCLQHGLMLVDEIITIVETAECDWCTQCEAVCPTGAISCPFEIIMP